MKKIIKITALLTACLLCICCLFSCDDDTEGNESEKLYHTVTFDFNNGEEPYSTRVEDGALVAPPITPERESYIFNGWKKNGTSWDFGSDGVYSSIDFVAQWLDAASIFSYTTNTDGTITVTSFSGKLYEVRVPEVISGLTVSALADGVFKNFSSGETTVIALPKTLTSVGASAFEGCFEQTIAVMGALKSIGERAFDGCERLNKIEFSDTLSEIPFRAFSDCTSLTKLTLPASLESIDENAFSGCSGVKTIIIKSKFLTVGDSAFAGCDSLVTVFFEGSESEWQKIVSEGIDNGGEGNRALLSATVYFLSESEPTAEGDYWYYNDDGEPRLW